MYQETINPDIIRKLPDGPDIPRDPMNRDYEEFLAWEAEGNTPLPADPEPEREPVRDLAAEVEALKARLTKLDGGG